MSINFKQLKGKVEYILQNYPLTRNDDGELYNMFLMQFYYDRYVFRNPVNGELFIALKYLKEVEGQDSIVRIRRAFNHNNNYLPTDPKVIEARSKREKEWRGEMSPSNPSRG